MKDDEIDAQFRAWASSEHAAAPTLTLDLQDGLESEPRAKPTRHVFAVGVAIAVIVLIAATIPVASRLNDTHHPRPSGSQAAEHSLTAAERAFALTAAHNDVSNLPTNSSTGWPDAVHYVTAQKRPGSVRYPNAGATCEGPLLLVVRVIGDLNFAVSPIPTGEARPQVNRSPYDAAIITMDPSTGVVCLNAVSVSVPAAQLLSGTVLYEKKPKIPR